jgi:tripartite-type tricarboxylate transporter receptor subunit TctC
VPTFFHRLRAPLAPLALGAALLCTAALAHAQAYPSKPITIVVPFGAGSGTDQQARSMAQALGAEYKVPVIVDNRAGASGFIAAQYVAKAVPDGYTMLMTTNTTHAANEHLFKKLPYDPVKDFTPVALLSKGHMLLLVNAESPIKSLAELIATARKAPGKLNFGSGSSSSRVASGLLL